MRSEAVRNASPDKKLKFAFAGAFLMLLAAGATRVFAANESRVTLTIHAAGGAVIRTEASQPRAQIEQQLRWQERMKKQSEGEDEGEEPATPLAPETSSKAFTDEEVAKKLREMVEERHEQGYQGGEMKLESIDVKSNEVRTTTTQSFIGLEDLLKQPYAIWGQTAMGFESVRFEKDPEGRLRVTLRPYSGKVRWVKSAKQMWKAQKMNVEIRFVFPGKVVTSSWPGAEGNATWITIDAKKEETLDAAARLLDAPSVITAELGGLKLDAPLDSKDLMRQFSRRNTGEPEMPVTDAGPGFAAEPLSVTVTTRHWFPDGQKLLKNAESAFGYEQTGAVVQAKLFAPKGRTLQSVTGVRVLMAVDDKGRPIASGTNDENSVATVSYSGGSGRDAASQQIQLRLPLPAADAQSVEQLDAEAIAVTTGTWKTMTLPDLSEKSTNEVDLASVLPGAKLRITKFTSKNRQTTIQAQIKGPAAIRQIDVQLSTGGARNSNSWMNERSFKTKGAESTRTFTLQAHSYGDDGEAIQSAPSLVVRYPEDQKRERVKFTLKALDLL